MSAHVKHGQQSQQPCGQCSRLSGKASLCRPHVLWPTRTTPGRVLVIWGVLKPGERLAF